MIAHALPDHLIAHALADALADPLIAHALAGPLIAHTAWNIYRHRAGLGLCNALDSRVLSAALRAAMLMTLLQGEASEPAR